MDPLTDYDVERMAQDWRRANSEAYATGTNQMTFMEYVTLVNDFSVVAQQHDVSFADAAQALDPRDWVVVFDEEL